MNIEKHFNTRKKIGLLVFALVAMMITVCQPIVHVYATSKTDKSTTITHVVKENDTLSSISKKYFDSDEYVQAIANVNNIQNIHLIHIGQTLTFNKNLEKTTTTISTTQDQVQPTENEIVTVPENDTLIETVPATSGRQITVETTAYDGVALGGVTATGNIIQSTNHKVIAVDPSVIPLGSRVFVPGYGEAIAWDTGGAIQGNIIDLNMSTTEAIQWGRQTVTVTILD